MSPKSNFDLNWNESADSAFIESKQILANATLLVHPDFSAQFNITCDADDYAVGGGDFVEGETNFVADALSRLSVSAIGSASVINYR